jgi:hypothetical protein
MAGGVILGIDPGLKGALAFLKPNGEVETFPMPTLKTGKGGTVDETGLARLLDAWSRDVEFGFVELQWARPTDGGPSAFKVGVNFGIVRMAVAASFIPYELVSPQRWKRFMQCPAEKDGARALASRLLPKNAEQWRTASREGHAEASLIALYAKRHPIQSEAA